MFLSAHQNRCALIFKGMRLTVLGSSSSGNGYVLQNDKEALVIECGIPFSACEEALDYNVRKVAGCLVSHIHGDHFGFVEQYRRFIPIYTSTGTIEAAGLHDSHNMKALQAKKQIRIGGFTVMPFLVEHDAPEPFGYLIRHPDFGLLLFATDTYYLRYTFAGLNYIMLECNYDRRVLDANVREKIIPMQVRERVLRSHLSCTDCIKTLQANDLSQVHMVLLLHLSNKNGKEEQFLQKIRRATGKYVLFAKKGLEVEFI